MDCRIRPTRCWEIDCPGPGDSRSDAFSIPQTDAPDQRLEGLPPFITVRGGAYFFLPGIRALRYLSQPGN